MNPLGGLRGGPPNTVGTPRARAALRTRGVGAIHDAILLSCNTDVSGLLEIRSYAYQYRQSRVESESRLRALPFGGKILETQQEQPNLDNTVAAGHP
jgi:hypothetical protein